MKVQEWNPEKGWHDSTMTETEFWEKFPWLKPRYMPLNYRLVVS